MEEIMRLFLGLLTLTFVSDLFSATTTITSRIYDIDVGKAGEDTLVLLTNGRVAKVRSDERLVSELRRAEAQDGWVEVVMDEDRDILAARSVEGPLALVDRPALTKGIESYTPTVIPSYDRALRIFRGMNRTAYEKSQCYNRAHVWSWEMYHDHRVRSNKIWIFFSNHYIRRYSFEWWFHVAPYVHVSEGGQVVERVMDFKYSRNPTRMKEWTDIFMHNNAQCSDIEKYTDYEFNRNDPSKGWCMLLRSSKFYYQPLDLEALEKQNRSKNFWIEWEVNNAYREAFGFRRGN
jgi:hypothetical protein